MREAVLLALDHSRREPWGSRHGSAFAAYTLQHPAHQARGALERCWTLLYRIRIAGEDPGFVARSLRRSVATASIVPAIPDGVAGRSFRVTIADLGDFAADDYPERLEAWCRATLDALGQPAGPA